ncbi:MAG: PSD1 domain-containing protein [Verrucomicrobiales bacterium]|nr:PSD1 domain-containing protein [Verrucomicrobiales bacterium]
MFRLAYQPPFPFVAACLAGTLWLLFASLTSANETGVAFFESRIRPALITHCYECHSAEAKKIKGGLRLDSRAGWMTGGDSGPAILPGKPEESPLFAAIAHLGDQPEMPPREKLPPETIADFRAWIASGAADPRTEEPAGASDAARVVIDLEAGRRHWAFLPPIQTDPPSVRDADWPRGEIDRHLLARQEAAGLSPGPDATPEVLVRRLTFDLTGLPPAPAETMAFLLDWERDPDAALALLVDRLLASPAFGEKWARHWLDLARYADSNGGDINLTYPNAWRYRDYVVDAYNRDLPYDQFLREQIAGDLIAAAPEHPRHVESLIATGFLIVGPKMLSERDKEKMHLDVADDQIDTVGRAILGLTLGCARCHDHKFDPVPTADYYALAGIFRSTRTAEGVRMNNVNVSGWIERDLPGPPGQKAMAAQDRPAAEIADLAIRVRGEPGLTGPIEPRGFLQVASLPGTARPDIAPGESGRRELAEWLTDRRHPLTARVYVNRLWSQLFGTGLVSTLDNFGPQGEAPSHPELLDWLAVDFMEHGWSTKHTLRRIALSRAYRLASPTADHPRPASDPDGRLLTHQHRRRLPAESIRDALLVASENWESGSGGSPVSHLGEQAIANSSSQGGSAQTTSHRRRSLYLPMVRGDMPDFLEAFDMANPDVATGERAFTTVPGQSLLMMNAPFVREIAAAIAGRTLDASPPGNTTAAIADIYRKLLGRTPTDYESSHARAFLAELEAEESLDSHTALAILAKVLTGSTEFRFLE